jgi:hypothetical protein
MNSVEKVPNDGWRMLEKAKAFVIEESTLKG